MIVRFRKGHDLARARASRWSTLLLTSALVGARQAEAANPPVALATSDGAQGPHPTAADDTPESTRLGGSSLGNWALPGLVSIPLPAGLPRGGCAFSAHGHYGLTERLPNDAGPHHRLAGEVALACAPVAHLALALRLDGRMDLHPADALGPDRSYYGLPRVALRHGRPAGAWWWGMELNAWFPGREAPSIALEAASADLRGLVAYQARDAILLASTLGYRIDRSGAASPDVTRLRPGDRSALGLSDLDALLGGFGVAVRRGRTEWLADLSVDLFVGPGAPGPAYSPLHLGAGWRKDLGSRWQISALGRLDIARRAMFTPGAPLLPTEPRLLVSLGIAQRPTSPKIERTRADTRAANNGARGAEDLAPIAARDSGSGATLKVRIARESVIAHTEAPTTGPIRVELTAGDGGTSHAETDEAGVVTFTGLPPGEARLRVAAAGFEPLETYVAIGDALSHELALRLTFARPRGQIRGLVRSYKGHGVRARISIEPLALEVETQPDGTFQVDVPPGRYRVTVRARGFETQERSLRIEENGVIILNADLRGK